MSEAATVGSTTNTYEILAKLATGGMAEIFLARATAAGVERYVVLKRVLHHRAQDIQFVQMFLDEARLAAQLQHANIAQVHDIGKLGDSFFFTMEYVHGETVTSLIRRANKLERKLPIAVVLAIVAGAAAGLHHAHERIGTDGTPLHIVHRDVSPSNLIISYEGTVKLVDFGVAKANLQTSETISGTVKGKISYLSPEQCRGRDVDRRSDLFSLGIVMWEMLTGERLFKKTTDYEHMEAIVLGDTPVPSSLHPEISPSLDAIVMKLLAKSPGDRYQTAEELVEAIEKEAISTGSALSTTLVARSVRELFGRRPEPWIELREVKVDRVTVVTEPVPDEIVIPIHDTLARELAVLPDFSTSALRRSSELPETATGDDTTPDHAPRKAPARKGTESPPTKSFHYNLRSGGTDAEPPPRRRRAILFWIGAAIVVGGGAVAVMAFTNDAARSNGSATTGTTTPAMTTIDATQVATIAEAGVELDASEPAVDAAQPIPTGGPPNRPHTTAELVADAARSFEANKFKDVYTACGNGGVLARSPAICVMAACKLHETPRAQRWFARVPARQHAEVTASCEASGVSVRASTVIRPPLPPPSDAGVTPQPHDAAITSHPRDAAPTVDCKADPLACQH